MAYTHKSFRKKPDVYRNMLKRVEWTFAQEGHIMFCPCCKSRIVPGHKPGCELAKLLREVKTDGNR